MSTPAAMEAESFLSALLMFFQSEFLGEFDHVDVHGVGVFGHFGGGGEGLESLGGPSTSLSNLLCVVPLVLEVGGFQIPVVNFVWDCVKGHDLLHKWDRDSDSEEAYEDIVVHNASMSGVALEG